MSLPGSALITQGTVAGNGRAQQGQQPLDLWRGLDRTKAWYVAQRPDLGPGEEVESEGSWEPLLRRSGREKDIPPPPARFPGKGCAPELQVSPVPICLFPYHRCADALRPTKREAEGLRGLQPQDQGQVPAEGAGQVLA